MLVVAQFITPLTLLERFSTAISSASEARKVYRNLRPPKKQPQRDDRCSTLLCRTVGAKDKRSEKPLLQCPRHTYKVRLRTRTMF